MAYQDKTLVCKDCGNEFVWTAGEQEFYAQKGLSHPPSRCKDDRIKFKEQRRSQRQMYDITCSNCGKAGQVPFNPRDPNSVLCADCFARSRAEGAPAAKAASDDDSQATSKTKAEE